MKKLILILCLALSAPAKADAGNAALHIITSAFLTTAIYYSVSAFTGREPKQKLPALIGAALFTAGIGLAMELTDSMQRGDRRIDGRDMGANLVGVGCASLLLISFDF